MMKKSFADIVASMENDFRRKVGAKIPSWESLEVPTALSFEQCSSERTADYKLRFIMPDDTVADLTGGLGVDSTAFASKASKLYYFEQNPELYAAAVHNFELMKVAPSTSLKAEIIPSNEVVDASTAIPDCDLIYMDPARRSTAGKKVFLLEDCTPNVLELLPVLWLHSSHILLKLSPMADISLVVKRLSEHNLSIGGVGSAVQQVHVVELGGEVKELLIYMVRGFEGEPQITATDLVSGFTFYPQEERSATPVISMPSVRDYIYVPAGAILKAGAYNSLGLPRLSLHSHLYVMEEGGLGTGLRNDRGEFRQSRKSGCLAPLVAEACAQSVNDSPEVDRVVASCTLFGKSYKIEEILPMNSRIIKELAGKYPQADVSCHDVPLRSEELAKRLKCKSGGEYHIFASSSAEGNIIIICNKRTC